MNCDEVQTRLSEYLEKSLDPTTTTDAERHLASCSQCRAEAESLADCIRHVASLPTVDPPLGFTQRVMAQVREIETKPSLWERLLFPLRIKIPIHATAVVLISILAVYLLEKDSPRKQAQPAAEPAFGMLEKKETARATGPREEFDASAQKKEKARANETPSRALQAPESESKPKLADEVAQPTSRREESNVLQDRREFARTQEPEQPSSPPPKKPAPGFDESAGADKQSSARGLGTGASAGDVASQGKKGSTAAELTPSAPASADSLSRSQPGSLSTSKLEQVQPAPDVDIIVRRAQRTNAQRGESLGALGKSAEREERKEARFGQLLPAIPESEKAQDVWLTIPRAQYDQLKKELLGLGSIESESWPSSDKKAAALRATDQLKIKVTVLPPKSEKRSPTSGSDR
ncbi:MAG: anti-sigma factor family protein [Candidatus Binatia bacterium]